MAATVSQCDMCNICTWLFCRLGFSSTFGLETVDFVFTCQCFLAHMWSRADAGHCDSGPKVFRPSLCDMQTDGSPPMPHLFFWRSSFRRQVSQVHKGFRCTLFFDFLGLSFFFADYARWVATAWTHVFSILGVT